MLEEALHAAVELYTQKILPGGCAARRRRRDRSADSEGGCIAMNSISSEKRSVPFFEVPPRMKQSPTPRGFSPSNILGGCASPNPRPRRHGPEGPEIADHAQLLPAGSEHPPTVTRPSFPGRNSTSSLMSSLNSTTRPVGLFIRIGVLEAQAHYDLDARFQGIMHTNQVNNALDLSLPVCNTLSSIRRFQIRLKLGG
jgi:hypothetical protein